jgi:hypothetical protein
MKSYFAPSPYDWPPEKVAAPKSLKDTDLYPSVTLSATRAQVKKFADIVEQEDELGTSLVAHFKVFDTLIIFYQSALDEADSWTVFVDMVNCVKREQPPTKLGNAVVRQLTAGAVEPNWLNKEADIEYRSRRRKPAVINDKVLKPTIKPRVKTGGTFESIPPKIPLQVANDFIFVKAASKKTGRFVVAMAGIAKKTVTEKKATAAKKARSNKT